MTHYNPADHPYPALRYGADAATRVVNSKDEDTQAADEGFVDHPSKVGQPKPAKAAVPKPPITPATTPAVVRQGKGGKKAEKPAAETPLEAAIAAVPAPAPEAPAFDRAAAIVTLEAANFEVDPATTDEELIEALAELAKG